MAGVSHATEPIISVQSKWPCARTIKDRASRTVPSARAAASTTAVECATAATSPEKAAARWPSSERTVSVGAAAATADRLRVHGAAPAADRSASSAVSVAALARTYVPAKVTANVRAAAAAREAASVVAPRARASEAGMSSA